MEFKGRVMRYWISALLALCFSNNALAKWVIIGLDESQTVKIYGDVELAQRNGRNVKMWILTDYISPKLVKHSNQYIQSTKALMEFDCIDLKIRWLSSINYDEAMGSGKVIFTDEEDSEYVNIAPNSMGEAYAEMACGKDLAKQRKRLLEAEEKQFNKLHPNRKNITKTKKFRDWLKEPPEITDFDSLRPSEQSDILDNYLDAHPSE